MRRAILGCTLLAGALLAVQLVHADSFAAGNGSASPVDFPVLQRFLTLDDPSPTEYEGLRHLEARNHRFDLTAWMDVRTGVDPSGFHYDIVGRGGSAYIQSHVFVPALEMEREMWASDEPDRSAISPDNYTFVDRGEEATGLAWVAVKPKRKGVLLVDGSIFLRPEDGDLVRVEGLLTKNPSFWTRHVEIVYRYERIAGIRLPVAFESNANVFVVGQSTLTVKYTYDVVNGKRVTASEP